MSVYGFCPSCGAPGVSRERRPNGNDECQNGHIYPSWQARAIRRIKRLQEEAAAAGAPHPCEGDGDPVSNLALLVETMTEAEVRQVLVMALFHLRCLSGSRNSFSSEALQAWADHGLGFPSRDPQVEAMHHAAADFIQKYDR